MVSLKKFRSWLLASVVVLVGFNAFPVLAQEDFIVTVGQDKVFTEFNYHDAWFENDPNNPEPWPDEREAYSKGNIARVSLLATPGHAGIAHAWTGVWFEWNLGQYTWEEVKSWPIKVTIEFSYQISAYWIQGYGSANAGVHPYYFTPPWYDLYDLIGYETGESGSRGKSVIETYRTTVEELEGFGRRIVVQAHCQAHSVYKEDEQGNPIGTTHNSSTNVTINSIKIEFTELPTIIITKAKMVSPTELGMAVKVLFPEDSAEERRFVKFTATVNNQPIGEIFDITEITVPGEESKIGVDINDNLDPKTPLRINLKKWQVERFTKNEKFELAAVAYIEDGIQSDPDTKEVEILLPAVIIHGIMAQPGSPLPVWLQRRLNPFLSKPLAYWPLIKYLETNTRGDFATGYDIESETAFGEKKYRTLWFFSYDSIRGTPESVAAKLEMLISKITSQTEAFNYANKVSLIGYSLGGLVGRYYIATYGGSDKIHRLIMVGTPNNGSSRFYTQLSGWSKDRIEKILNKMPLLSWFIPTYDVLYENYTDYPYYPLIPFIDNSFPNDPLPANVAYHSIYGVGQKTFRALIVDIKKDWYVVEWKEVLDNWGTLSSPGDMTVPEEGAKLPWAESNLPVNNNLTHPLLPADSEVQSKILYECLLQDN